ncbi:fimbrial protein [Vibrio sp. V12_P9A6T4]|nr:fimbrial protein [Vibrio sp. V12_P9A6T4]OXX72453.1 fimbrial protein [Vibrio sp. V03_P4A6T147]
MTITAEVFERSCSIRPGDEIISVDFGSIVSKMLLLHDRTASKPFQIHLEECNLDFGKNVKVTFSGQAASEDSALLALTDNSQAKGIAIGLEQGGKILPINKPSSAVTLGEGNNVLDFSAYVQLLPSAQEGITAGAFQASANFTLEYD